MMYALCIAAAAAYLFMEFLRAGLEIEGKEGKEKDEDKK